jgi:hypothetical protein
MTSSTAVVENLTLRDPAGQLYKIDEQLIRIVQPSGLRNLAIFLRRRALNRFVATGKSFKLKKLAVLICLPD